MTQKEMVEVKKNRDLIASSNDVKEGKFSLAG